MWHLHLLWHGFSTGAVWISAPVQSSASRDSTCFTIIFSVSCRGISILAPPHPPPSPAVVSAGLLLMPFFSHFSLSHSDVQHFYAFEKICFPSTGIPSTQSWPWGSAVPCAGSVGAGWNWLCPAWSSPDLSSQRPLCSHPIAGAWALTPNTVK